MADDRAERMRRLVKVQKQLHRIEEWRLAEIQGRLVAIDQESRELIDGLNSDSGLQGLFMDATAKRLETLAGEGQQTEILKAEQAVRVQAVGARVGVAERMLERAERDADRVAEAKLLSETMERLAARRENS